MKKLLFSLVVCGFFARPLYLSAHEAQSMIQREEALCIKEADEAHVKLMGSLLSATWIANTCITMPLASRFLTNQLIYTVGKDNAFLAIVGGVGMGYLASVATEQMINCCVLKASKQYGNAIVTQARRWINGSTFLPELIGLLAFFASLPAGFF